MRSKKRSVTSRKPPEPITFFVDRSLGHIAGQLLRDAGATVQFHDDHFPQSAPDVEWIPTVGAKGWVVVTKDKRIRYRILERDAITAARLRVFVLASSKGLTGEQMGRMLVRNLRRMESLARKHSASFAIAGAFPEKKQGVPQPIPRPESVAEP
jgi:uncharacterized protein with PIN domain